MTRYSWIPAALLAMALPLTAAAVPRLVTIPVDQGDGTVRITFRIVGVTPTSQVAGANFEIPTNDAGYEVIGGEILNPDPTLPGDEWIAAFNPTATFRPGENDYFLSFFACREVSQACEFRFLSSDFDIATLDVREIQPGSPIDLKPASAIATVVDGVSSGVDLGGQTINAEVDSDLDGVVDGVDNCVMTANPDQLDRGGVGGAVPDGIGDACQCGDVTGDGSITIADALVIRRSLLDPPTATPAKPQLCDVGGTAGCSIADALIVQRALLVPPTATIGQQCPPAQAGQ